MTNLEDIKPGDKLTLEHGDGSRLVGLGVDSVYSVLTGERRSYVRGLLERGWSITDHVSAKPKVGLPTEPYTAYVDRYGTDIWTINGLGNLRCVGSPGSDPAKYAPFTRLIPEDSTLGQDVRDQAIRDVIGTVFRSGFISLGYAKDLHEQFGVTP